MILIADSGGSKTDWALVGTPNDGFNVILKVRTQGLKSFSSIGGYNFQRIGNGAETCVKREQ